MRDRSGKREGEETGGSRVFFNSVRAASLHLSRRRTRERGIDRSVRRPAGFAAVGHREAIGCARQIPPRVRLCKSPVHHSITSPLLLHPSYLLLTPVSRDAPLGVRASDVNPTNRETRRRTTQRRLPSVSVRQTASRELPSLQEQAVRAEQQRQPEGTVQQLQCVQRKCH